MEIIRGKIVGAQKFVVYGPEGIGKTTFASKFPEPLFIDTEGSTKHYDVARLPTPSSFQMIKEMIQYVIQNPNVCKTLVLDTADWTELLAIDDVCSKHSIDSIETLGYGKGYVYLSEEIGKLLNMLTEVINKGINVVITAHAAAKKVELPDEMGAYDRWELKLQKKVAPLVKEWADNVFFLNYKTIIVNIDNKGSVKGKNKAQGGKRVMYTTHHVCWDAKNRLGLPEELDVDYTLIAPYINFNSGKVAVNNTAKIVEKETSNTQGSYEISINEEIPLELLELMKLDSISVEEIKSAVASKGYYPIDTHIGAYDMNFVKGVLVGAWPKVKDMVLSARKAQLDLTSNIETY